MPQHRPLTPAAPWVEVVTTDEDWDAADPGLLRTHSTPSWCWIRAFEQYVLDLAGAGLIHGPAHSSIGQEGGAVGSVLALTSEDSVNGSHRGHHQFLAKALHHVEPRAWTRSRRRRTRCATCCCARSPRSPASTAAGATAAAGRCTCSGRSRRDGHQRHRRRRRPAGGRLRLVAPHAGTDAVSVTYFGDGAVNIGSTLETMNLAGAWALPVCFFIENNRYAVSTSVEEATAEPRLSARGLGFGLAVLEGRRDGPARRPPRDDRGRRAHAAPAAARPSSRPTPTASSTRTAASPGSAFGYRTRRRRRSGAARPAHAVRRPARAARPPRAR